jgi:outer membrane receptor protein involved in Fe transport
MIRNYSLLVFFVFVSLILYSQESFIKGKITDAQTKETLIGVNVILSDNTGAATDIDGNYTIKVKPGKTTVTFKYIGYKTVSKTIDIADGETKVLNLALEKDSKELDVVVVSAGRFEQKLGDVTVSMEVIKPELIENKNTTNMETIIDQTPGVSIIDGQANIRGGGGFSYGAGSRVLLLVDDMPMITADAGDIKWNFIPVENIEQVEVIKGASSALFGSSALNGAINIRTAYPKSEPVTKINVFHGMYGDPVRRDTTGSIRDSLGYLNKPLKWWTSANPTYTGTNFLHSRQVGNLDVVVGAAIFSDEGYREGEKEQRGRANFNLRYRSKKIEGLNIGLNGNGMYTKGGLFLIWQDADSGAYRPAGGRALEYTSYRVNIDPYINYFSKKGDKISVRTRYFNSTNMNDTRQQAFAHLYFAEAQYQKQLKNNLNLTFGSTNIYSVVKSDLYGNHFANNSSFYGQVDKKFWTKLSVSLGVRLEHFRTDSIESLTDIAIMPEQSFWGKDSIIKDTTTLFKKATYRPIPRLGINYQLFEFTYLRASYGQGFRFPSIAERFIRTSASGLEIYPNLDLKPETGWSAEVGVKQGIKLGEWKGFLDLAYFMTRYRNMVEFSFGQWGNPAVDPIFGVGVKSLNVGYAEISGWDGSVMGTGKLLGINTTITAGYTYMIPIILNLDSAYKTTLSDTTLNILKYRFRHLAKADVQFDLKKVSMGISFRYNSFMENVDYFFVMPVIGDLLTPGYRDYRKKMQDKRGDWVFDYRISYQMTEQSKIALIINNVFNREYMIRPADIQAPRTVALQYGLQF